MNNRRFHFAPSRRCSAFTLIEMLVVVAILGILAAMIMPAIARARRQAYTTACAGNLRQIGIAHITFQDDNRGNVMDHESWLPDMYGSMAEESFQCPGTTVYFRREPGFDASYLMNIIREDNDDANYGSWRFRGWQSSVNTARIASPENTIFVTEIPETFQHLSFADPPNRSRAAEGIRHLGYPSGWSYDSHGSWDHNWENHWTEWAFSDTDHGPPITDNTYAGKRQVGDHHAGGFNALMGGGSVEHMIRSNPTRWIAYQP